MPALLTSTSIRPSLSTAAATIRSKESGCVRSAGRGRSDPGLPAATGASATSAVAFWSTATTSMPLSTRPSAMARPSPLAAPVTIAPVAPLLIADLALSYAELGLLIGLYLLPGTVLALPGGLLGERFGNCRVVLWALALMVDGGLVTAASDALWQAAAGRLVSGA